MIHKVVIDQNHLISHDSIPITLHIDITFQDITSWSQKEFNVIKQ